MALPHFDAKDRSEVLTGSGEAPRSGAKCARGRRSRLTTSADGQTPAHLRAYLGEKDMIPPPNAGWRAPGAERRRPDVGSRSPRALRPMWPNEPPSAASAACGRSAASGALLHHHAEDLPTRNTHGKLRTNTGSDRTIERSNDRWKGLVGGARARARNGGRAGAPAWSYRPYPTDEQLGQQNHEEEEK